MNFIALDLEMEQEPRGTQYENRIIQIGAVAFTQNGEVLERFVRFIKMDKPLSEYIKDLTRITDDQLAGGTTLDVACRELFALRRRHKASRMTVVWGQGDAECLKRQLYELDKTIEWGLGRTVMNVKNIHQAILLANGLTTKGGLKDSMPKHGAQFVGDAHDAVVDAENTAKLFCHLLKQLKYK